MADIMRDAQKRIEDIRRRTVKIVVRRDGSPVPDAQVELRMNRHQFLFGCDCYCANTYDTPEKKNGIKNCSLACLIMPPCLFIGDSMSL